MGHPPVVTTFPLAAVSGAGRGAGEAEAGAGSQQTGAAGPPGHAGLQHTGESTWGALSTPLGWVARP